MLAHLRKLSLRRSSRSWVAARHLSGPFIVQDEGEGEDVLAEQPSGDQKRVFFDPKFEEWLASEGKKYEDPFHKPRNWLGEEVPFPLNPSFKPAAPISDVLRTLMYKEYMSNPEAYSVRALSERYGISMKRVDAILRLKGLEEHWKKNKPLQTGFLVGMEEILGVTKDTVSFPHRGAVELGEDATQADSISEAAGNNAARGRYQRLFWEPVVDGKEPILPGLLEREHAARDASAAKKAAVLATYEEHTVSKPGHANIRFVNVGRKYVDETDVLRRDKESQRRSLLKARKRQKKAAALQAAKAAH